MRRATLRRSSSTDQGTTGILTCDDFFCFIKELPWRDNIPQKSCIPVGDYVVAYGRSPKFGLCYHVIDVPNRGSILIHAGNYVGNTDKGLKTHSHGCLLPAKKLGIMAGQEAGLMSGIALHELETFFNKNPFVLEIRDVNTDVVAAK